MPSLGVGGVGVASLWDLHPASLILTTTSTFLIPILPQIPFISISFLYRVYPELFVYFEVRHVAACIQPPVPPSTYPTKTGQPGLL